MKKGRSLGLAAVQNSDEITASHGLRTSKRDTDGALRQLEKAAKMA